MTGTDVTPPSGRRLRTVLLGAGSLGRAFLRRLRDPHNPVDLVGIITARHGRLIRDEGMDPSLALNMVEADGLGESAPQDFKKALDLARADVLVECIPQNIRSGEPALGLIKTALESGVHVVTSNKAPVALAYRDLAQRAAKSGVQLRFEATVLDGLPLFSFVQHLAPARITKIRGVLNATSSVVLETVGNGGSRARGLARAQAQGVAEADSVLDLDGWDAAAKAALLANVWMGGQLRVVDVSRAGLDTLKDDKVRHAAENHHHYRLVAQIQTAADGTLKASVEPVALEPQDPLYGLHGAQGGITLETDQHQSFTLLQQVCGIDDAAYGILSDIRSLPPRR